MCGLVSVLAFSSPGPALAWQATAAAPEVTLAASRDEAMASWSKELWAAAHAGPESALKVLLDRAPIAASAEGEWSRVLATAVRLRHNIELREQMRSRRHAELTERITLALAKAPTDKEYSDVLRWSTELQMISQDREAALQTPLLQEVTRRANAAAAAAEARSDWLFASELFYRLHALTEEQDLFKEDMDRLNLRLTMLRLYVPEKLWELRRDRAMKDDASKTFPSYNPIGMGFQDRLAGIDERMVLRALVKTTEHVDRVPLSTVTTGALMAVPISATGVAPAPGAPVALFPTRIVGGRW